MGVQAYPQVQLDTLIQICHFELKTFFSRFALVIQSSTVGYLLKLPRSDKQWNHTNKTRFSLLNRWPGYRLLIST